MARFDEYDYTTPPRWRSLAAQKRLDLSASVEGAMLDASLQEEQESDDAVQPGKGLIPPRLSLQSKQLPVAGPALPPDYEHSDVPPAAGSPAQARDVQRRPFLSRRTTKVRLQVVPAPRPADILADSPRAAPAREAITNPSLPLVEKPEPMAAGASSAAAHLPELQTGVQAMGVFERGQRDLAVHTTGVTASSVVLVVLTGDPGPVVVQYITLQPGAGFTVHLSAPTQNMTPFNYVII